jgi:hypothetical protein
VDLGLRLPQRREEVPGACLPRRAQRGPVDEPVDIGQAPVDVVLGLAGREVTAIVRMLVTVLVIVRVIRRLVLATDAELRRADGSG